MTTGSPFKYITIPGLDFHLTANTTAGGRFYITPEGRRYPSASTITSVITKEAIDQWKKRIGTEEADRISKQASTRGTCVHLICEKYLRGTLSQSERLGMLPTIKELFLQLRSHFDAHIDTVYCIEQPLYSDRLKIAGRTDGIVSWDSDYAVIDIKTSKHPKPEAWILNYFIQTTAYAEMFEERTGIPINTIVVAMAVEGDLHPTIYVKSKQEYLVQLHDCIDQFYTERGLDKESTV